mgnify:CR=1 FL=1
MEMDISVVRVDLERLVREVFDFLPLFRLELAEAQVEVDAQVDVVEAAVLLGALRERVREPHQHLLVALRRAEPLALAEERVAFQPELGRLAQLQLRRLVVPGVIRFPFRKWW